MITINGKKFIRREYVRISRGSLTNVKGHLESANDSLSLAYIRVGTVTHIVPYKWIEKTEPDRMKLFAVLTIAPDAQNLIFQHMDVGIDLDDMARKYPDGKNCFMEIDEVDGYDVILQK